MRTLSTAAAIVALTSVSALAQTATAPALIEVEDDTMMVEALGMTADALDDMDIYDAAGEKVGEVDDVLMTADGQITAVSAEVGGFLGIGDKDVVLELSHFTLGDGRLVVDMTKEEVEALPDWDD